MRVYEVVYIFDASLDEAAVDQKLEPLHAVVTAQKGAEITEVDHWGNRQLAYSINGSRTGYYVVAQFRADPDVLPEFERQLKLEDDLMRYLVVLNEGEPTTGMSILAPQSPSARDDDEEDEDDEEDDDDLDDEEEDDDDSPPEFSGGRGRRRRVDGPAIELLNYKDVATLSRFMTEQGKILPRRTTKVAARFQRQLGRAVKRARYLGLVPYVRDHEA